MRETQLWQPAIYRLLFHILASPTCFLIAMDDRKHRCMLCVEAGTDRFIAIIKPKEKPVKGPRESDVSYQPHHIYLLWLG